MENLSSVRTFVTTIKSQSIGNIQSQSNQVFAIWWFILLSSQIIVKLLFEMIQILFKNIRAIIVQMQIDQHPIYLLVDSRLTLTFLWTDAGVVFRGDDCWLGKQ